MAEGIEEPKIELIKKKKDGFFACKVKDCNYRSPRRCIVKRHLETSLKIFKHYKLKPSFSIIKDEKAKVMVGVGDKPPLPSFNRSINPNLIQLEPIFPNVNQFDQVSSNLNQLS